MLSRHSSALKAERILRRSELVLNDVTKQVSDMVTEKTNLMLDYVEKFINQTVASTNPPEKLDESRSVIFFKDSTACKELSIDIGSCVPYIYYLDKKHRQFVKMLKAPTLIADYFKRAERKCDKVSKKQRCKNLVVSRSCLNHFKILCNFPKLMFLIVFQLISLPKHSRFFFFADKIIQDSHQNFRESIKTFHG